MVDFKDLQPYERADVALSDLASGGLLNPTQSNTFVRKLLAQPTILQQVRYIDMPAPKYNIDKIGIGTRFLYPATQSGSGSSRYLAAAKRAKPTFTQVQLSSTEYIGSVYIPYEVLEDNIEKESLQESILDRMVDKASTEFEELIIKGDTGSLDELLATKDGLLKMAVSNVVNMGGAAISKTAFEQAKITMPDQYLKNPAQLRWFLSTDMETQYRSSVADRQTALGDTTLTGLAPLPVFGIRMEGCSYMPSTSLILTDPKNIIFGFQRKISIEYDRDIESREIKIVMTLRADIKLEEEEAVTKVVGLELNTYN